METRVLVLDANQRSSLAVIRSLGKLPKTLIFAADSMPESIGGSSKYVKEYLCCPSPKLEPSQFLKWISKTVELYRLDKVFPCTEISSQLLLMHKDALRTADIPFADLTTVLSLADKANLMRLAHSIAVPTPKTYFFNKASEVKDALELEFPMVIKPYLSHILYEDHWLSTKVEIAYNKDELERYLQSSLWLKNHPFMIQEFIDGHGQGIFALYNQGKSITFFAHQRIREKPPSGGVSVLCESVALDPKLKAYSEKILDHVNWHGVAMIEFRIAKDGTPYLMEVNTRFWGSLQLAIDAGVDFPALLYRICQNEQVEPVESYRTGIRMRWLLGDLDSLYLLLRQSHFRLKDKLRGVVDFFTPHPLRTYHQINRWEDPMPAWTEFKAYLKSLTDR
jgi:predicted ATP-grasp superfamily ATP-dependent carboligase